MIYLDYSATTEVGASVLASFVEATQLFGNPNSVHALGKQAKERIDQTTLEMTSLLRLNEMEIVYTSGATEANNLAICGTFDRYSASGRTQIITTEFEHPSVLAAVNTAASRGASVAFVRLLPDGTVDPEHLKSLLSPQTLLVSIGCVNSELGIRQPVEKIGEMVHARQPGCFFHSDVTQAIGKTRVDFSSIDLASFSAHKFYGIRGIGALLKRKNLILQPQICGGSSTTRFRSGTPCTELIVSMGTALGEVLENEEEKYQSVLQMNRRLRNTLGGIGNIAINSTEASLPHILNFSLLGTPSDSLQQWMSNREIYFSTRTACSSGKPVSRAVLSLTGSEERAKSSVRISLSYHTTYDEIQGFADALHTFIREECP